MRGIVCGAGSEAGIRVRIWVFIELSLCKYWYWGIDAQLCKYWKIY